MSVAPKPPIIVAATEGTIAVTFSGREDLKSGVYQVKVARCGEEDTSKIENTHCYPITEACVIRGLSPNAPYLLSVRVCVNAHNANS